MLTLLNTIDTALGVVFLAGSWFGFRAWLRNRAQDREDALGAAGSQDTKENETAR